MPITIHNAVCHIIAVIYAAAARTQSYANADFLCAMTHQQGNHAVDTDRRQEQPSSGEQRQQRGVEAWPLRNFATFCCSVFASTGTVGSSDATAARNSSATACGGNAFRDQNADTLRVGIVEDNIVVRVTAHHVVLRSDLLPSP